MPDDRNPRDDAQKAKLDAFWERAKPLIPHLQDPAVNEVVVNDPGTIWLVRHGRWERVDAPEVNEAFLETMGSRLANYAGKEFNRAHTSLSTALPSGERVEMTHPPSCPDNTRYLNIRKHAAAAFPHETLVEQGYYATTRHEFSLSLDDKDRERLVKELTPQERELWDLATAQRFADFIPQAVRYYQNIVISGATGTGKTSYMRALIELIDPADRIVTLEDTHEMPLPNHPNHNHLFYRKNEADEGASADDMLRSVMRKTPTRVIMAELRGSEAMTYLSDVISSGHPGGLTTTHAGSPKQAMLRLAYLIRKSPEGQGMTMDTVLQLLHTSINVVVQLDKVDGKRQVSAIYYDPMHMRALLG